MTADPFVAVGTYSGDPGASTRDAVRFEVGDTGPVFEFSDAEVSYALARAGSSVLYASADLADALAVRFAGRAAQESQGDVSVTWGSRSAEMAKAAARLRARATTEVGASDLPVGLGTVDGSDGPGAAFWRGMHDHPWATGPDVPR